MKSSFKLLLLLGIIFVNNYKLYAQSNVAIGNVIEKITTNPATGYEDNYKTEGNPNDGSAKIYFTTAYVGKVKSVKIQVHNLADPSVNPIRTFLAEDNLIQINGLHSSIYDIVSLTLNNGSEIKAGNLPNIIIYSANRKKIPFTGNVTDYTKSMEGNNVQLFEQNFAIGHTSGLHISQAQYEADKAKVAQIIKGVKTTSVLGSPTTLSLSTCTPGNAWVITSSVIPWDGIYRFFLSNINCPDLMIEADCIQHGTGSTNVGDVLYVVGGDFYYANLILAEPTGTKQTLQEENSCGNWTVSINGSCVGSTITSSMSLPTTAGETNMWILPNGSKVYNTESMIATQAGTYTVVYASGICSKQASVVVSSAPSVSASGGSACAGSSITLTASGASSYSWSNGATGSSISVTPASTTTYTVTGSSNGCSASASATATVLAVPLAPVATVTNPTCTVSTGSISVTAVGGVTFSFDNGAYSATNTWSGLIAGSTHTIKAKNASGCISAVTSKTIGAAITPITTPTLGITQPNCTANSGIITVTSATAGLTFSFDGGAYAAQSTWSGLAPNTTHTVLAKNASGCISSPATATLGAMQGSVQVSVSSNQTTCSTTPTTLTAVSVPAGATFAWNIGTATGTLAGTGAVLTVNPSVVTTYFVTATGSTGCTDTKSIVVTPARPSLILTSVITICKGNSQDVIADGGGIPTYTYRWLAPAAVAGVTTPILTGMTPLVTTAYTVERTTPQGCKDTATSTIKVYEQPILGIATVVNASCSGANDGSITINATSASGLVLEYSINGTNWQLSNVFSNLAPGTYSILVRNQNGVCQAISGLNVTITRMTGPTGTIVGPGTRCALDPAQFQISPATAGATYSWSATGTPTVTGTNTSSTYTIAWPVAGVYTVSVDITLNGCTTHSTLSVSVTAAVVADAGPNKTICKGGATRIGTDAPAGSPTVSYSWYPTTGLSSSTVARPLATPATTTIYTVTVTDIINGCTKNASVTVIVDVQLNPTSNAGPDKTVSATAPVVSIGSVLTSPNPWNGYTVNYLWSELTPTDNNVGLANPSASITNFTYTTASARSVWTYELLVQKVVPAIAGDPNSVIQYCEARDTVNITKLPDALPDLSPVISFLPATIVNPTTIAVVTDIYEFNNVATFGLITVYIPKDPKYSLNYNPTATIVGGRIVNNSLWTFDNTSNPTFYIMTTNSIIPASGVSSFGFTTFFDTKHARGQTLISAIILDKSGGEALSSNGDNADDDTLIFKVTDN